MPNSKNTSWIVSCVLWHTISGYDMPVVTHCDSRTYRYEDHAMERYNTIIDSFKERHYEIEELKVPENESYFGVQICTIDGKCGVVYVDRNPVYRPG